MVNEGDMRVNKVVIRGQQKTYERQWRLRIARGNTGLKRADVPFFGIQKDTSPAPKMYTRQTQTNARSLVFLRLLRHC